MKKIGFTIGKFAPLHKGHQYLIEKAIKEMDDFIIVIYETDVISIPIEVRKEWIQTLYPSVKILIAQNPPMKYGLDKKSVNIQIKYLKEQIGDMVVTHFYSSEKYGEFVAKHLKVQEVKVDHKREYHNISASRIRRDLEGCKSFLEERVYQDIKEYEMGKNLNIRERLIELKEEEYKKFHMKLCTTNYEILGVRIPHIKALAKEIIKQDDLFFLNNAKSKYYEEVMLQGLVIGLSKMEIEEKIRYIEEFVPKIDNWAICDSFCSTLKDTKKNETKMWEVIQGYLKSKEEFDLRFAVIMMMDYYLTPKYIEKVLNIVDQIHHEGYYVKMGVAWLISVAYIKDKAKTMKYLLNNNLDKFTYNKGLQKIIESNRVSQEEKEIVRNMKRKE